MRRAAVVLAGGEGRRLGGAIKANLEIGGIRLLDRALASLEHSADVMLVATGRFSGGQLLLPSGVVAVPDLDTGQQGPLSGIAAAVAWLRQHESGVDSIVSVAVDTPFFPVDFVARALALADGEAAVIARYGGQDYPTNALWRLSGIADLPDAVAAGTAPHSLRRLALERGARWLDWPGTPDGNPFANVNTPEDLAALQLRAALQPR